MTQYTWPAGGTLQYHSSITNGAGGGGNISVQVQPGQGNECLLLYGQVTNGDTSARNVSVSIRDDGDDSEDIFIVPAESVAAAGTMGFPHDIDNAASGGIFLFSGRQQLILTVESVAAAQDAKFTLAIRCLHGVPTITENGNSTPTISITIEEIQ